MTVQLIQRGGARKGAGRPSSGKVCTKIFVLPETIESLTDLGGDNLSAGVDMAARRVGSLRHIGGVLWMMGDHLSAETIGTLTELGEGNLMLGMTRAAELVRTVDGLNKEMGK